MLDRRGFLKAVFSLIIGVFATGADAATAEAEAEDEKSRHPAEVRLVGGPRGAQLCRVLLGDEMRGDFAFPPGYRAWALDGAGGPMRVESDKVEDCPPPGPDDPMLVAFIDDDPARVYVRAVGGGPPSFLEYRDIGRVGRDRRPLYRFHSSLPDA